MTKTRYALTCVLLAPFCVAFAQDATGAKPANPITTGEKGFYSIVAGEVIRAAEKMPEENYAFKPTPEVRSFGQLIGHVADAQYYFCATAAGEKPPAFKSAEQTKTSKADLIAALKDAVAYCKTSYDAMTDAQGAQTVTFMKYQVARLTVFSINTAHTDEHYGNMVTYLRMKGIVPPSSEKQQSSN